MTIDIQNITMQQKMGWLQHVIAPRPIAFASTIDKDGNANLSPFSFFNLFSYNPAIVILSAARSGRTNQHKHTLLNVLEVPEMVINICDYDMVQQVSLSSAEFAKEVDEFIKSGFTKQVASMVKPPLVKEAKAKLECKVIEVKPLGEHGGAGQLIIAEVLLMHVDESILNAEGNMVDQEKYKLVARLGGNYYGVMNKASLFEVARPILSIGIDELPLSVKHSKILTGNHLGQLANVPSMPDADASFKDEQVQHIIQYYSIDPAEMESELHRYAALLLNQNKVDEAWQVLLYNE